MHSPGDTIAGRFEILGQVGTPGSTAEVFLVRDRKTGDDVVCKIARDLTAETRAGFLAQYEKLLKIRSPDVAAVLGYDEHDEGGQPRPILVQEHVQGETLEVWLSNVRSLRSKLEVLARVARVLDQLHTMDIPHGDIHSRNILLSEGRVVLIDPWAEKFGSSVGSRTSREPSSIQADLKELQELAAKLLDKDKSVASPVINSPQEARIVAGYLEALLLSPRLPGELSGSLQEIAESRRADKKSRSVLYRRIRAAKNLAIDGLIARLTEMSKQFEIGPILDQHDSDQMRQIEAASDSSDAGIFVRRRLELRSDGVDSWQITFEPVNYFRKPWPYEQEGLICRGQSLLTASNFRLTNEVIELRFQNDAAIPVVIGNNSWFPCDDLWVERGLRLLARAQRPILATAHGPPASVTTLEYESGVTELRDNIGLTLHEVFTQLLNSPEFGQREAYGMVNISDDQDLQLLNAIPTRILGEFGRYIACLYCVDVSPAIGKTQQLDIFVIVRLARNRTVSWKFRVVLGDPKSLVVQTLAS